MAYYINGQILDFNTLRKPAGGWYDGDEEIKKIIAGAWQELHTKFWSKGLPAVFITPGIRSGGIKGNQGYSVPRSVAVKTKKGNITVAWAEEVKEENGRKVYMPVSERIRIEDRTLMLSETEIEKAIWMHAFNPARIGDGRIGGKTFLQDLEAEALKYAETETNAAVISYWLFRQESFLFTNEIKLSVLCLAYGINPDGKSLAYKKQLLAEAVKKAEKHSDPEFGLNAFNRMCEQMKDGQDTRLVDCQALVQKASNRRVIKFDEDKFEWQLLAEDGKTKVKTICKVNPQQKTNAKVILRQKLMESPDEYDMIAMALSTDEEVSELRGDKVKVSTALLDPADMSESFITGTLTWHDRKRLYQALGHDPRSKTDAEITPVLIEYFVLQRRTLPFYVVK